MAIGDGNKPSGGPWTVDDRMRVMGSAPNGRRRIVALVYRQADVPLVENALELRTALQRLRDWCDEYVDGIEDDYKDIMRQCDTVLLNTGGNDGNH